MNVITFITSNSQKLNEIRAILGKKNTYFDIVHHSLELPELQATPDEIAINKCITAATIMQGPVIVEDTILAFNSLNGLPGPYIKTFIAQIGLKGIIKILSSFENKTAQASCTFAYTEGANQEVQLFTGTVNGKIIVPASFTEANNWDSIFQPDGYDISYGMMQPNEKNKISHRYKALVLLKEFLLKKYA